MSMIKARDEGIWDDREPSDGGCIESLEKFEGLHLLDFTTTHTSGTLWGRDSRRS